jgi:hypothetical protein
MLVSITSLGSTLSLEEIPVPRLACFIFVKVETLLDAVRAYTTTAAMIGLPYEGL